MNQAESDARQFRSTPLLPMSAVRASERDQFTSLMTRCANGDVEAFAELYDRTSARVYGVALWVLRSGEHAAEVAVEVYVGVWQNAARIDPHRGSVLASMVAMTCRRAVDRVRSVTPAGSHDRTGVAGRRHVRTDVSWEAVENQAGVDRIRRALGGLSPTQLKALRLAYGGQTHIDVSALLDVPVGTVKTRIKEG